MPARPTLTVRGSHTVSRSENHGRKHRSRNVTDFDFKVDLAPYVVSGRDGEEDGWYALRVVGDGDGERQYRGGVFPSRRWKGHSCCRKRQAVRLEDEENVGLVGQTDTDGRPGLIG